MISYCWPELISKIPHTGNSRSHPLTHASTGLYVISGHQQPTVSGSTKRLSIAFRYAVLVLLELSLYV